MSQSTDTPLKGPRSMAEVEKYFIYDRSSKMSNLNIHMPHIKLRLKKLSERRSPSISKKPSPFRSLQPLPQLSAVSDPLNMIKKSTVTLALLQISPSASIKDGLAHMEQSIRTQNTLEEPRQFEVVGQKPYNSQYRQVAQRLISFKVTNSMTCQVSPHALSQEKSQASEEKNNYLTRDNSRNEMKQTLLSPFLKPDSES